MRPEGMPTRFKASFRSAISEGEVVLHVVDHPIVEPECLIEVGGVTGSEALGTDAVGDSLRGGMIGVVDLHPGVNRLVDYGTRPLIEHREAQPIEPGGAEGNRELG